MKAFGKYISKYLLSFFVFALVLLFINILAFALTFGGIVFREYGAASPANMLEAVGPLICQPPAYQNKRNKR